ncbi:MAG TPA: mechanosensitive ion channel [Candidatus Aphodovivens avistercoris]|nr:mechanosensitive ion channel [Candidatus Aphodovivens avistercoris]
MDGATETAEATILEEPAENLLAFVSGFVQVDWLSTAIVAVVALAVTAVVSRVAAKLIRRVLSHDSVPLPSSSIFVNIVRVVVWAIGVSVVLSSCFGVDVTAAVAALGIGGIAISLGFQDTLANLISGLQLSIMGIIEPGDNVDVGGQRGIVRDVTWRHTTLVTSTGEKIVVPNSVLNTSSLIQLPPPRKVVVPISVVAEGDELTQASERIAQAASAAAHGVGAVDVEPSVTFSDVTAFGFTGSVVVWMAEGVDPTAAKDAVVRAIAPLTRDGRSA